MKPLDIMFRHFLILTAIILSPSHGHSTPGLCESENRSEPQVQKRWCDIILDQLTSDSSCTSKLVDKFLNKQAGDVRGMKQFCPQFGEASRERYKVALVLRSMIASLIKRESEWNPSAENGGRSFGLLMIGKYESDANYKCACGGLNDGNRKSPEKNLRCGTHAFVFEMVSGAAGLVVGEGTDRKDKKTKKKSNPPIGAATKFGPFLDSQRRKRDRIAMETHQFCTSHFDKENGSRGENVAEIEAQK